MVCVPNSLLRPSRVCVAKTWGAAQGDTEEETGCPPLFEFASPDDAEALDLIADAVLSPEDDPDGARCVSRVWMQAGAEVFAGGKVDEGSLMMCNGGVWPSMLTGMSLASVSCVWGGA